jgi:hypothetical protein
VIEDGILSRLSLPELLAGAEHHERQSRSFFRQAHGRSGPARRTCLARAQHSARAAHAFREWAGC